jgi:S1-C subfamily serine protease
VRELRLGVFSAPDSSGHVRVINVEAGSAAAEAGLHSGDVLVSIGDVAVTDVNFGARLRARYGSAAPGTMIPVTVKREQSTLMLSAPVRFRTRINAHLAADPAATLKAKRVRAGILHGTVGAA